MYNKDEIIYKFWKSNPFYKPFLKDKLLTMNGWISEYNFINDVLKEMNDSNLFEIRKNDGNWLYRPKILNGVEDNNGWTTIENEQDLPKEGHYHVVYKDGKITDCPKHSELCEDDDYWIQNITHYQPIEKPNAPFN